VLILIVDYVHVVRSSRFMKKKIAARFLSMNCVVVTHMTLSVSVMLSFARFLKNHRPSV
jgi:hypothetical protein